MKAKKQTKPTQDRAIKTEQKIVDAARRLLIDHGYEKITTNHIAEAAGCNIGTLYRYFPNKDDVIVRMYQDWLAEAAADNDRLIQSVPADADLPDLVVHLFLGHLKSLTDDDHRLAIEFEKALKLNIQISALDEAHDDDLLSGMLEHCKNSEALDFVSSDIAEYWHQLALALMQMVHKTSPDKREFVTSQAAQTLHAAVGVSLVG